MRLIDPKEAEAKIAARYQVFLILWISMLSSLFIFLVVTLVIPSSAPFNRLMSFLFLGASVLVVIFSLVLKNHFLKRAMAKQEIQSLMNAYVVGFALCDVAALLGVLDHMSNNSPYFYFAFIVAGMGLLLHFPKKDHVRAILFK
ncbi:MAG TPA: hypothetical protein VGQ72_14235 [Pyrinomonadaceae bacterium]|jgi:hypothetical protein|nr:hypothetical protein [Pyrinomonadaceae bacterium]